jgi:hypothetical protein
MSSVSAPFSDITGIAGIVAPPIRAVTARKLLEDFKPIESIIDGLPIARGGLTLLTARTGHGKTTIATLLEISLCRGLPIAGRESTRGSVLVLAGENPDDYTMHLAATLQELGLTGDDLCEEKGTLLIVPGVFNIDVHFDYLRREASGTRLVAVIVDTSAAFYLADEENDNVAMRRHASMLRELTRLPGSPAVIVLCHPTKNATQDGLLPRGGGSFTAEVDANLTLWKDDNTNVVTLHWHGKIRGPSFDPIRFELAAVELAGFKDCRGKAIFSSVARHIPDQRAEQIENREINDQDRLLSALRRFPGASVSDLARDCGWVNDSGEPLKTKTDRRLKTLEGLRLAERDRKGKWKLTNAGQKDADALP